MVGPIASLGMVAVCFAVGIVASIAADRRDPEGAQRHKAQAAEGLGADAVAADEQTDVPEGEDRLGAPDRAPAEPKLPPDEKR